MQSCLIQSIPPTSVTTHVCSTLSEEWTCKSSEIKINMGYQKGLKLFKSKVNSDTEKYVTAETIELFVK